MTQSKLYITSLLHGFKKTNWKTKTNSSSILNIINNNHHNNNNNNSRLASGSPSFLKPVPSPSLRHWKFFSSASSSVAGGGDPKDVSTVSTQNKGCVCDSGFTAFSALMETEEGSGYLSVHSDSTKSECLRGSHVVRQEPKQGL